MFGSEQILFDLKHFLSKTAKNSVNGFDRSVSEDKSAESVSDVSISWNGSPARPARLPDWKPGLHQSLAGDAQI